ncbi:Ig-like domain-containing protein [Clostridium sp.]|uniref:Ig-like domain-containing protein n=1 Tax=Clostridium sp. TaxID=1506 RepID=UPI001B66BC50|nr:Ig-like domain-containing protein [Clostridium sp.]MBP3914463.1 Ig-like domain-containing protein [Clostridium sp.]
MKEKRIIKFLAFLLCFMQITTIAFAESNIKTAKTNSTNSIARWFDSFKNKTGNITIVGKDEENNVIYEKLHENLKYDTYTFSPPEVVGYTPTEDKEKTVKLTRLKSNVTIVFKYKQSVDIDSEGDNSYNSILPGFENWPIAAISTSEITELKNGDCKLLATEVDGTPRVDYPNIEVGNKYRLKWEDSNSTTVIRLYDEYWGIQEEIILKDYAEKEYSFEVDDKTICLALHSISYPGEVYVKGLKLELLGVNDDESSSEDIINVQSIDLNEESKILSVGDNVNLTVKFTPENATNKNILWSSSDTQIAEVDSNGKVYAKKAGEAIITATSEDGKKTAKCIITVQNKEDISLNSVLPKFEEWSIAYKTSANISILNGTDCNIEADNADETPRVDFPNLKVGSRYKLKWENANANSVIRLYDENWSLIEEIILSNYKNNEYEFTLSTSCICLALHALNYPGEVNVIGLTLELVDNNSSSDSDISKPDEDNNDSNEETPSAPDSADKISSELKAPDLEKVNDDGNFSTSYFNYDILVPDNITSGTIYYLSPNGSDTSGNGSKDKPWKSINKVRTYVDNLSSKPNKVIILMKDGDYEINSTQIIKGTHFGTVNCPVEIRGIGNKVRITTGTKLSQDEFTKVSASAAPGGKECYVFDLSKLSDWNKGLNYFDFDKSDAAPDYDQGKNNHTQSNISDMPFVSINGERLYLASYPNKNNVTELSGSGNNNGTVRSYTLSSSSKSILDKFTLNDSVNKSFIQSWWSASYYSDTSVISSYSNGQLTFSDSKLAELGSMNYPLKSKIYNVKEQLNEPSTYWIDYSKNKLYVIPPENTDISSADIMLSYKHMSDDVNERALIATNSTTDTYVTFERISFSDHRSNVFLISKTNTLKGVKFYKCRFVNIGRSAFGCNTSYGHYTSGGTDLVKNAEWRDCKFGNIGEFGLYLVGGNRNSTTLPNDNIKVYNCIFKNIGCYGAYLTNYCNNIFYYGAGMEIKGNKFTGSPGITVRWRANNVTIEDNIFEDCVWADEDSGCVYMGNDWSFRGNKINYNIFRDTTIGSNNNLTGSGVAGIYCDDYSSGAEIIGNTISGFTKGIMMGGGRDSYIENNDISNCVYGIVFDARGLEWQSDNLLGPVIFFTNSAPWESWRTLYPELNSLVRMTDSQKNDRTTNARPVNNTIINNEMYKCKYPLNINSNVSSLGKVSNNLIK